MQMILFDEILGAIKKAQLDRREIAGSLGDMGTFLPLLIGMATQNGLNFASALFFAGLFNVITGLTFTIPMAVQPMKAIAAVAITEGLTVPQILAAGASVSAIILLLGVTGLIDWLNGVVPKCIVRGLQLALGLSLVMKGLQMVAGTLIWFTPDGFITGIVSAIIVLLLFLSKKVPAALVLFIVGIGIAIWSRPQVFAELTVSVTLPAWTPISWADFIAAFPKASLPQIPLTALNSVIAVCALSADLFPDRPVSPRKVAVSVGLMNLVATWFGGMPLCHGAGGLAGQYRFGARTNGSILFLGAVKMLLAVFLGASLLSLCRVYPMSVLGVLLVFSGMELAVVCRDQSEKSNAFIMFLTAAACLGLNNIAIGFAIGLAIAWGCKLKLFNIEKPKSTPCLERM